jgi:hypothetical protein
VQAQLRQELETKLDIAARDVNGLATTGIALRNRFWELGGTLSDVAYPYIYAARLVDEMAQEKAPDNPAVTDQLVESIMAYEVMYYWQHPQTEDLKRNPIYRGLLADLRRQQFEQLQVKVAQGYTPTWRDFVRCNDFALLWSRRDPDAALAAIRLLLAQAPKAGWTFYLEDLRRIEQRLLDGEAGCVTTFLGGHQGTYLDQYSRRLWSFQGPQEFRENCVPTHLRHLKGW